MPRGVVEKKLEKDEYTSKDTVRGPLALSSFMMAYMRCVLSC